MGEKVFVEFFRFVNEGIFVIFDELAADGTERVGHGEINGIRLRVKAFGE